MSAAESKVKAQMRTTVDRSEINELLRHLCKCNIPLVVWQNDTNGHRILEKMLLTQFNTLTQELKLEPQTAQSNLKKFSQFEKLYIYALYKNFVAQVDLGMIAQKHIYTLAPKSILTEEERRSPRKTFISNEHKVKFRKQNKLYEYSIVDISESGMAFKVPEGPAPTFNYKDDEIQILRCFDQPMPDALVGNVVYMRDMKVDRKYRVGIKFQRPFPYKALI